MALALILYGTTACHLCEEALAITLPLAKSLNLPIQIIDIAGNDGLEDRYGIRIPVITYGSLELGWPFNIEQVAAFLKTLKE